MMNDGTNEPTPHPRPRTMQGRLGAVGPLTVLVAAAASLACAEANIRDDGACPLFSLLPFTSRYVCFLLHA